MSSLNEIWSLGEEPREGEHVSDVTLRELISNYYRDNQAGGNAHIVFDEESVSDGSIHFCIQQAILDGDWVCAGILMEFLKRHPKRREAIVK